MMKRFLAAALFCLATATALAQVGLPFPGPGARSASSGNDSFTKILLHMDGTNGGTTFTDSNAGGAAHTWTANSATTNTGTLKFGTASENAGAAVGWIDTPDSADFTLGSGDWTVDFWFNRQGGDGTRRIACGQLDSSAIAASASFFIELLDATPANVVRLSVYSGGTATQVVGTTAFTATGWNHVAAVRTGNVLKLFVNGVQEGGNVAFSSTVTDSANKFAVGRVGELASLQWNGFIDEFRLSVGTARWTSNFTPPTVPYSWLLERDLNPVANDNTPAFLEKVA